MEFDLLRRRAGPKMRKGSGSPEPSVSARRVRNAAIPRQEKALAAARTQEILASSDVAMTMRRFFGSCGGAVRQDSLAREDVGESAAGRPVRMRRCGKDQEARAAYGEAKEQGMGKTKGGEMPKDRSDKVKVDGQTLNGFSRRTRARN